MNHIFLFLKRLPEYALGAENSTFLALSHVVLFLLSSNTRYFISLQKLHDCVAYRRWPRPQLAEGALKHASPQQRCLNRSREQACAGYLGHLFSYLAFCASLNELSCQSTRHKSTINTV
jgi:hypothetical protein